METAMAVYDPAKSLELQKVGTGLFKSGLFPNAKNEFGAYAIVQYGAELGIGPMMSLKNINIISGQVACNAQLMLTLALQKGVTYEVIEESDIGAKVKLKRGNAEYTASFTKKDAESAGLLNKDNWKKYPRDMYFWRTIAKGVRRIAPDAVMGLYTAEEISEGKYVDIVEIPKPTKEPPPVQEENQAKPLDTKSPLHKKIEALISEAGIDREIFKEWLGCISWIKEKEGRLSLSTLSEKNAKSLVDKWDSAQKTFNAYVDAGNQPGKG